MTNPSSSNPPLPNPSSSSGATRANASAVVVDLRNPMLAGLLAWLFPGAGHLYQRRYFKAGVFGVCIWSVLLSGLFMGSYRDDSPSVDAPHNYQFARTVYCSWRPGDKRLYFIPQACVGCVALPAWLQSRHPVDADGTFWSTAFAPPRLPGEESTRSRQPSVDEIVARLHSWLDVSTIFTVVAGLLNLFAIFDALGGPAPEREEEDEEKDEKEKDANKKDVK